MVEQKGKKKLELKTRTPKKVTPSGIFDNLRRLPHPVDEITGFAVTNEVVTAPAESRPPEALLTASAPTQQTAPVRQTAPTHQPAPVRDTPQPLPVTGAVRRTAPVQQPAPARQAGAGFTKLSHDVADNILRTLDTYSQSVLIRLLRLSWGFQADECRVGLPTLANSCNISQSQARRALRVLIERGLIELTHQDFSNPIQSERGTTYKITLNTAPIQQAAPTRQAAPTQQTAPVQWVPNKETHIKETHTNTEGVGVRSRFTLSDCRRYAESLRKDGITNPGGYATKIYRSGEADLQIEEFLSAAPPSIPVDISGCPDCQGTGFWEPGGTGKGVAKCKHEKLLPSGE